LQVSLEGAHIDTSQPRERATERIEEIMPDWLVALLGGVVLLGVLIKAFWNPAALSGNRHEDTRLPPGASPD
jgi:hypothetical protein